jgi:flagellar assembly protein FliH
VRGAALAEAPVTLALRPPPPPPRPAPGTPEGIVADAQAQAAALLAGAHEEIEAARAAALAEGLASGRAEAMDEVASALEAIRVLARDLHERRAALEREVADEAAALAVEVAAKLLRAELAARPERVADVVRGAIRRAGDRSRLVAHVSPGDLAACRAAAPAIVGEMGGIGRLEVVDDPRISRGSCVLETSAGDVDATFESQLARVLEALLAPPDESLVP